MKPFEVIKLGTGYSFLEIFGLFPHFFHSYFGIKFVNVHDNL